jgi:hypothetical protein
MRDEDSLWARCKDAAKTFFIKTVVVVVVFGLFLVGLSHASTVFKFIFLPRGWFR